jgi:hypothetical protein
MLLKVVLLQHYDRRTQTHDEDEGSRLTVILI